MSNDIEQLVVPDNLEGKAVDIEQHVTENTEEEAVYIYKAACLRLLTPIRWKQLAGPASAAFRIFEGDNNKGSSRRKLLRLNDFIMIDIPGPGPLAGNGYDWVKVETLQQNIIPRFDDSLALRLRACANPNNVEEGTAHFFKEYATSTFIIKRKDKTVTISYHGRNEKPNVSKVGLVDTMRNALVASGAVAGLSGLQWKALITGILQKKEID